jgi:serine/threonine-protein kinase
MIGTVLGSYTVRETLGEGGMATVYLAHDARHDRPVALKVIRDALSATLGPDRFLQEIRTTARLQHPHILPLLDSGEVGGRLFYVMPYVAGETLRARLDREKTVPLADVARLAAQLASALGYAHRHGVVHRDIKPENILLNDGLPLVADFGIALAVQQAAGDRLTATGGPIGTPAYMSPEQIVGAGDVDARTDQYSLACVVFEAIAGRPPYRGATSFAVASAHVTAPVPALTSDAGPVPPAVVDVVRRALAKSPSDRFQGVADFAAALASAVDAARIATPAPAGAPAGKSIVVLPFDNLSPDPGDAYLADGLTEELTADLARVRALRVTARNSAIAAKARTRDVRALATLLGTRYVLEGSVRRAGAALRITAQLIDGTTDAHLWSEKYSGSMDDVFAMQERISREIVTALAIQLSAEERREIEIHPIANLEAYQLYLQARHALSALSAESVSGARQRLDRALALEGDNEVLLGLYGVLEAVAYSVGADVSDETLRRVDACATRALALNPRSALGLYAKAILAEKTDLGRSVHYLRQSVAVRPVPEAMGLLAIGLAVRGQSADAMDYARQAVPLDPLSAAVLSFASGAAWFSGAPEQALAWAEAGLRAMPDNTSLQHLVGYFLAATGQTDRALALLDRAAGSEEFFGVLPGLLAQAIRGQPMSPLTPSIRTMMRADPHGSLWLADIHAAGNDRAQALDWLSNAIRLGVVGTRYMTEISPFLVHLRGDPGFQDLVAQARAKAALGE